MDYEYRMECLSQLHEDVKTTSCLSSLHREYTLDEIAIILGEARISATGLNDRGSLRPGSLAD